MEKKPSKFTILKERAGMIINIAWFLYKEKKPYYILISNIPKKGQDEMRRFCEFVLKKWRHKVNEAEKKGVSADPDSLDIADEAKEFQRQANDIAEQAYFHEMVDPEEKKDG